MAIVLHSGLVGTGLVGPNRPAIEAEYGLNHTLFGVGISVAQCVVALALVVYASKLRTDNPPRVVNVGLVTQLVGFALIFATKSAILLLAGWLLISLGVMLISVTNNMAQDLWPGDRRRGVILLHFYNSGGKVLGPAVVAACIALAFGWRWSFVIAGVMVIGLMIISAISAGQARQLYRQHAGQRTATLETNVLRDRFYWLCVLPFGLIAGGEAAFATLAPTYYFQVKGLSQQAANMLLTVHLVGLMSGRLIAAFFGTRFSSNTIIAACLSAGVFVFPAIYVDQPAIRIASLVLLGLTFSATWPTFYAQVAPHWPDHRPMLAFGSALGNMVGIALCVLLSSMIADVNLLAAVVSGPVILWLFGLVYYTTRLSRSTGAGT